MVNVDGQYLGSMSMVNVNGQSIGSWKSMVAVDGRC